MRQLSRDTNKRLKGVGFPIELCFKMDRAVGVQPGKKPTYDQRCAVGRLIVAAVEKAVKRVKLTSLDYKLIAREIAENEKLKVEKDQ